MVGGDPCHVGMAGQRPEATQRIGVRHRAAAAQLGIGGLRGFQAFAGNDIEVVVLAIVHHDSTVKPIFFLRRQQPAVRLSLTEAGVESLWRQLAEGALDALVGRLPGPSADMHRADGLRHLAVGSERMVLVGGALHPLANTPPRGRSRRQWLQALASSEWVLPPADALAVINFNEWFASASLLPPSPAIVSGSFYASLNMVARTELLTVVPESAARGLLATLGLAMLRTPWSNPPVEIVFAARESNWGTAVVAALRACFTVEAAPAPTQAARPAPSRPRARPPA